MNPSIARSKKQRTNDVTSEKTPEKRNPIAPLAAAEQFILSNFDTLQPALVNPLWGNAKEHVLAMSLVRNKTIQIKKMESNALEKEFFPRSVQFAFKLNVSKEASKTDAFDALQKETEEELLKIKQKFKSFVVRATKIERDMMLDKIRKKLCFLLEQL